MPIQMTIIELQNYLKNSSSDFSLEARSEYG